jgi:IS5 family transposase
VSTGTIVDATIIDAPSSTKNNDKARDPEMHQTKKGNQWYFGMKAHIGVDSQTKLIHSVAATAANVHDSQMLEDLLKETRRASGVIMCARSSRQTLLVRFRVSVDHKDDGECCPACGFGDP